MSNLISFLSVCSIREHNYMQVIVKICSWIDKDISSAFIWICSCFYNRFSTAISLQVPASNFFLFEVCGISVKARYCRISAQMNLQILNVLHFKLKVLLSDEHRVISTETTSCICECMTIKDSILANHVTFIVFVILLDCYSPKKKLNLCSSPFSFLGTSIKNVRN